MTNPCPECAHKFVTREQMMNVFKPIRDEAMRIMEINTRYKSALKTIESIAFDGDQNDTGYGYDIRRIAGDALSAMEIK